MRNQVNLFMITVLKSWHKCCKKSTILLLLQIISNQHLNCDPKEDCHFLFMMLSPPQCTNNWATPLSAISFLQIVYEHYSLCSLSNQMFFNHGARGYCLNSFPNQYYLLHLYLMLWRLMAIFININNILHCSLCCCGPKLRLVFRGFRAHVLLNQY